MKIRIRRRKERGWAVCDSAIVIAWNIYILFRPCLVTSRISKNLMCLLAPVGDKSSGRTQKS